MKTKELTAFDSVEFKIEKPKMQGSSLLVTSNYEAMAQKIQSLVEKYKGEKLTDKNVEYIASLRKQFASLRLSIERERKEYKKAYLDPPARCLDDMCRELQAIIAEGEVALEEQLSIYDQKRKDDLTLILTDYIEEFKQKYGLRPEFADGIILRDRYYNKTQKEEDSIIDIEEQAQEQAKKQKEYDSSASVITSMCGSRNLLAESYLRSLQWKSLAEILQDIEQDAQTNSKIKQDEKIVIGEKISQALERALTLDKKESKRKTKILRITYEASKAKAIAKFFKENSIEYEFIELQ